MPFPARHPSLAGTADVFAASVRRLPMLAARIPVYSAVLGRAYESTDDIPRGLAAGLTHPVRLPEALWAVSSPPFAVLLEAGTGTAVTTSAEQILAQYEAIAIAPLVFHDFPW